MKNLIIGVGLLVTIFFTGGCAEISPVSSTSAAETNSNIVTSTNITVSPSIAASVGVGSGTSIANPGSLPANLDQNTSADFTKQFHDQVQTISQSSTSQSTSSSDLSPKVCDSKNTLPCLMPVWYEATRVYDGKKNRYTKDRTETGKPNFGLAEIVIPKDHERGSTGSSFFTNLFRKLTGGQKDQPLEMVNFVRFSSGEFWMKLNKEVESKTSNDRIILLYIHGFNVSFNDSMISAAQLGYDLGNPGITAAFTWPTLEEVSMHGFYSDSETMQANELALKEFIVNLAKKTGATKIHIIAHSLGNKGLIHALEDISNEPSLRLPIGQIILAAPAIDKQEFEQLAYVYPMLAEHTTLYISGKDKANKVGAWFGNYPFVGYAPPITIVSGIDTIDVSATQFDLIDLGHSYVGARPVLDDIHSILLSKASPSERVLHQKTNDDGKTYWYMQ